MNIKKMFSFRENINQKHFSKIIFSLCTCVFILFSYFLYNQTAQRTPHCDIDSSAYLEKADLFYKTHSFYHPNKPSLPYYGLGYSLFISGIYSLTWQSKTPIIWAQILLSLLSFLLLFILVRRLFGLFAAYITLILCACNIGYLTFSQFILTEILLSFFLILFFERLTAFLYSKKLITLIISGGALGCSIVIKPAALYYPLLLIPFFLYVIKDYKVKVIFIFLASFYTPILGYMTHNFYTFRAFKIGSLDTENIYHWFYPNVRAYTNRTTSDVERKLLREMEITQKRQLIIKDLQEKPFLFIAIWLINAFKSFVGLYTTNLKVLVEESVKGGAISFFKMKGTGISKFYNYILAGVTKPWVICVGFIEAFFILVRIFFIIIGLLNLFFTKRYWLLYLFMSYAGYFLIITGHDGCARFRMMIEWNLLALTAFGIAILFKNNIFGCFKRKNYNQG